MNVIRRKYKDYLSAALSATDATALAADLPVASENLGLPLSGMVKYSGARLPSADPDVTSSAPADSSLYTHPGLPGLLFATITSRKELFRRGSSFVIEANGNIFGFIGADAEGLLLGGYSGVPQSMINTASSAAPAHFRARSGAESAEAAALLPGAGYSTGTAISAPGNVPIGPLLTFGVVGHARMEANAGDIYSVGSYHNAVFDLRGAARAGVRIMSVLTSASRGWVALPPDVTIGSERNVAALFDLVPFKSVYDVGVEYQQKFMTEVPSDLKKYYVNAYADELRYALKSERMLEVPLGVSITVPRNKSIDRSVHVGIMRPHFTPMNSYVGASRGVSAPCVDHYSWDRPALIACTDPGVPLAGQQALHSSMLWATSAREGNDLVSQPNRTVQLSNVPTASLKTWWNEIVEAHIAPITVDRVNALTAAAGVQEGVSPNTVLVGTTKTNVFQTLIHQSSFVSPLAGGPIFVMREFFRRVHSRAEQYARAQ